MVGRRRRRRERSLFSEKGLSFHLFTRLSVPSPLDSPNRSVSSLPSFDISISLDPLCLYQKNQVFFYLFLDKEIRGYQKLGFSCVFSISGLGIRVKLGSFS